MSRPTDMKSRVTLGAVPILMLTLMVGGCSDSPVTGDAAHLVVGRTSSQGSYKAHRRAAAAESAKVVGLVPVPPGSTRLTSPPASWSGPSDITSGPSDLTLTRTAWWTVPGDVHSIRKWLTSHAPPGLPQQDGVGGGSDGIRFVDYVQSASPDPAAYLAIDLLVQWGPGKTQDGALIVRADTFTAARAKRNSLSYLPRHVASVEIRQVAERRTGVSRRLPDLELTWRHDRPLIEQLVTEIDGLYASIRPVAAASCPAPPSPRPRLDLTLHTRRHGGHVFTMRLQTWCFGQIHTTRDGRPVRPTLDAGGLPTTVDHIRALSRSSSG